MKTIITITAHAYEGSKITAPEKTYSFVRGGSAKKPTYTGAARMVASEIGCAPKNVSVTRVEFSCYDA